MQERPVFSIILCTHNGRERLPRTLAAVAALDWPEDPAEVVLVDNASTDGTAETFPEALGPASVIRLHEPRPGKSFALNRGLAAARGALVVFIDDDVRPVRGWLRAFAAAARGHPAARVFCGQVRPDFEVPPPPWLAHICATGLAMGTTSPSPAPGVLPTDLSQVRGANLMVRSGGDLRFDEGAFNFSAVATGGEDTEFVARLIAGGPPPLFVPEAEVAHWVTGAEMSKDAVRARNRTIGSSMERFFRPKGSQTAPALRRSIRKATRQIVKTSLRYRIAMALRDATREGELLVKLARIEGRRDYLRELAGSDSRAD
jgi:glucosyl-dolichyl phosphate glucuronosyltransferase